MNLNNHITKTLLNEYAGSEKRKQCLWMMGINIY